VCHALLQSPNFFRLLLRIDEELASRHTPPVAGAAVFCTARIIRASRAPA
jgi:hypothetical protein